MDLIEELVMKPRWEVPLVLRFLQEKYEPTFKPRALVEFTVDETGRFRGQFRNRLSFFCCSKKAAKLGFNFDCTRFQWFRSVSKMAEFEFYKCQMQLQRRAMLLIR